MRPIPRGSIIDSRLFNYCSTLLMDHLTTLREVLHRAEEQPWDAKLYLPTNEVWELGTRCAVLVDSQDRDEDEEPPFARENGLTYALLMSAVQDIVSNAQQQVANITPEQMLAALLFFYDCDAFIDFGSA